MVPSGGMIKKLFVNNYIGSFSSLSLSLSLLHIIYNSIIPLQGRNTETWGNQEE